MANRLIHSTSPYLLQHAHNPVDWFEWGPEALEKARKEDKPILVSIGYSSCHWCHVMERESFEKTEVAEVMNRFFVNIKIDREERPDIDQIYMDAVHALGIQGGWPLNVFLTPDQKPFFGGTYFAHDTWIQVLNNIHNAFQSTRDKIEGMAEELRLHLLQEEMRQLKQTHHDTDLADDLNQIYERLANRFDTTWGGLEKAPKFIMPSIWLWLLRYYYITQNEQALHQISLTLKRIAMGGIYDQIGGGFARYSVDKYWFAPHFEKMLYDNAQLISLYSEAYAVTKDEAYKTVVYETFDWLQREMTSDQGGLYSALDADSEGVEGKFYVWTKAEIDAHLGDLANVFAAYYAVDEKGNWVDAHHPEQRGNSILMRRKSDEDFLQEHKLTKNEWQALLRSSKKSLLHERSKRARPALDDKIITAWNAMMVAGLTDAYRVFGDLRFCKAAIHTMRFLENGLMEGIMIYRSYKDKPSHIHGFLDDYAFVVQALIKLYEVTFEEYYLHRARVLMEYLMDKFHDNNSGFFHYTSSESEQLLTRKKEMFDNVIPSSNSVMAQNLFHLGTLLDYEPWIELAKTMTLGLSWLIKDEPANMSNWAIAFTEIKKGLAEVAFVGKEIGPLRQQFHQLYHPFTLSLGTYTKSDLSLLTDKKANGKSTIYVCYNKSCKQPVHDVEKAVKLIV